MKFVKGFLIVVFQSFMLYIAHMGIWWLFRLAALLPTRALFETYGSVDLMINAITSYVCLLIAPAILFKKFSPEKTNYILSIKDSEWKLKDDLMDVAKSKTFWTEATSIAMWTFFFTTPSAARSGTKWRSVSEALTLS